MNCNNTNVSIWEHLFNKYIVLEQECSDNIIKISSIKNNLKILLGNQKKDDILFYKSIIDNSHFYLSSSFTIRKNKLLTDLNNILSSNSNFIIIDKLNKHNFINILRDYTKLVDKINIDKISNGNMKWVKNNKIASMTEFENNMNEVLHFHIKIFNYFNNFIKLETKLYCETKRHVEKEKEIENNIMNQEYNDTIDTIYKSVYVKEYNNTIDKSVYVKEYNDTIDKSVYVKEYNNDIDKSVYVKEYNDTSTDDTNFYI